MKLVTWLARLAGPKGPLIRDGRESTLISLLCVERGVQAMRYPFQTFKRALLTQTQIEMSTSELTFL